MKSDAGIYQLTMHNGQIYIGSSVKWRARVTSHLRELEDGIHGNSRMQRVFNKYGLLDYRIILVCRREDLLFYEQVCLDGFKPKLNLSKTAERTTLSAWGKRRIGRANARRFVTKETRAKMSAKRKGKPKSEEMKAKLRGRKVFFSVEHRRKISVNALGNTRACRENRERKKLRLENLAT